MRISVVGGSTATQSGLDAAEAVGREIATRGHTLVCGGKGGVMRAACRGAADAGGETVGILPGTDPAEANSNVTTPIVTGIGHARNVLVVRNGDAVVAVEGGYGTLSEIAHAKVADRPVVGIDTHDVDGVAPVDSATDALDAVETARE